MSTGSVVTESSIFKFISAKSSSVNTEAGVVSSGSDASEKFMLVSLSFVSSETRESRLTTLSESLLISELLESAPRVASLITPFFFPLNHSKQAYQKKEECCAYIFNIFNQAIYHRSLFRNY